MREPELLFFFEPSLHMLHMVPLLILLLSQLVEHDQQLLLLLLCCGQLAIVLQRSQLLLQTRLLLVVRRRRHKAVIHRQRPERRIKQRTHVLPDLGSVQCPYQINHRLHHVVDRLQIALRLRQLLAALQAPVQSPQLVVPRLDVVGVHGPRQKEGHVRGHVILADEFVDLRENVDVFFGGQSRRKELAELDETVLALVV